MKNFILFVTGVVVIDVLIDLIVPTGKLYNFIKGIIAVINFSLLVFSLITMLSIEIL